VKSNPRKTGKRGLLWHKSRKYWKKLGGKWTDGKETKGYKSVTAKKETKFLLTAEVSGGKLMQSWG
jgi:hypothetical protein